MKNDSSLYLTAELLALYETQYQNVAELQLVEKKKLIFTAGKTWKINKSNKPTVVFIEPWLSEHCCEGKKKKESMKERMKYAMM